MKYVTIAIDEFDYRKMLLHFSEQRRDVLGSFALIVRDVIDHDPDPTDDRAYSPYKCAEALGLRATEESACPKR